MVGYLTMLKAVVFDLGNTLIQQQIDRRRPLDRMNLQLLPGAVQTLEALRPRLKLGLLSNTVQSTSRQVALALEKLGIAHFFDYILTSVDAGIRKPDPQIFHSILKHLAVRPEDTLMVGNDIKWDIAGAKEIGMHTVFFSLKPQDWKQKWASGIIPDYEISALFDLLSIVDSFPKTAVKPSKKS
jgi:HAD superfamily hydrolase (TIGR01662 family)